MVVFLKNWSNGLTCIFIDWGRKETMRKVSNIGNKKELITTERIEI